MMGLIFWLSVIATVIGVACAVWWAFDFLTNALEWE